MTSINGRDFFELVKAIGESKSKQEEDRIIAEEVRDIATDDTPCPTTSRGVALCQINIHGPLSTFQCLRVCQVFIRKLISDDGRNF